MKIGDWVAAYPSNDNNNRVRIMDLCLGQRSFHVFLRGERAIIDKLQYVDWGSECCALPALFCLGEKYLSL